MKKNEIKELEEIRKERKLSKDAEKTIKSKIVSNFAICLSIVILMMAFAITANYLEKNFTMHVYNASAVTFLVVSIIIFEVAYKRDSGSIALYGVEVLCISIFTLFAPYIFLKYNYQLICYGAISVVTLYYIIKIIITFSKDKKKFQYEKSDFSQIIKKESKDEEAIKEQENILTQMREMRKQDKKIEKQEKVEKDNKKIDAKKESRKTTDKRKTEDNKGTKKRTTKSKDSASTIKKKEVNSKTNKLDSKEANVEEKKTSTRGRKKKTVVEVEQSVEDKPKAKKTTTTKKTTTKKSTTAKQPDTEKKEATTRKPRTTAKASTSNKTTKTTIDSTSKKTNKTTTRKKDKGE